MLEGLKTIGKVAGGDDLAVVALRRIDVVIVVIEAGVAQLLGLLVTFIGEELTLRLVREVWPKLSPNNLDFGKGDNNEKPK